MIVYMHIITDPLLHQFAFSPGIVTWPLLGCEGGGVNTLQWKPHGGWRKQQLNRERESPVQGRETDGERGNSWRKDLSLQNLSDPGPESGQQTRRYPVHPPCQSPSEERTQPSSSWRISSGTRNTIIIITGLKYKFRLRLIYCRYAD